jgi:hypothetical protein
MRCKCFTVVTILILTCFAHNFAQQPGCALKQSPELYGFRLGMPLLEVSGKLTDPGVLGSKMSSKNGIGTSVVNLSAAEIKLESDDAIESIALTFVESRLTVIKVTYNGDGQWSGAQDYFVKVSEKLGLPKPSAQDQSGVSNERGGRYTVECIKFKIALAYMFGVSPTITLSDKVAESDVDKRREKEEDNSAPKKRIRPGLPPRLREYFSL